MTALFVDRLWAAVREKGSPVVVGLDPRPDHLPPPFAALADSDPAAAVTAHHRALLDVVAKHAAVVKPQAAFFEAMGPPGSIALGDAIECARERGLLVILDGKRGDIGSTASAYAEAWLGKSGYPRSDALTVNPYLGEDACRPFLDVAKERGAGLFFLVKTSNPGAGLFQNHGTPPLAEKVASQVAAWGRELTGASGWSSVGAVVGATRPEELARFRELMPETPLLLPGFGFQGGKADGLGAAFNSEGLGALVSASRSILWAHEREDLAHLPDWEQQVDAALGEMVEQVRPLCGSGR